MNEDERPRCETCRFWDSSTKAADDTEDRTGLCFRSTPTLDFRTGRGTWPTTECDDICGEWEMEAAAPNTAAVPVQADGEATPFERALHGYRIAIESGKGSLNELFLVKDAHRYELACIERERDEARAALEKAREIDVGSLTDALIFMGDAAFESTRKYAEEIATLYRAELAKKIPAAAADVPTQGVSGRDEPGGGICEACGRVCHEEYGKLKAWAGRPACDDCRCPACRGAR